MATPMTLLELHDAIAKAIADAIGHGMREKCERHADAVLAVVGPQLLATAEHAVRIEADEAVVPVAKLRLRLDRWDVVGIHGAIEKLHLPADEYPLFVRPPAQAAQVDDKVVVMRDGKATTSGLVLAAAIYMGAVKDIFKSRPDGPPYNERSVLKDTGALRAFDHLDAATKALRAAISHFEAPAAEPGAQGEDELCDCDADKYNQLPHHADCAALAAQSRAVPDGWKLAMWVLQSDLYRRLPEEERAVCEALVAENPYIAAPSATPKSEPCTRNCDCVGPCKAGNE